MTVFTYWDQPAHMPAYLRLCLATWQEHLNPGELVLLIDANLERWVPPGILDREALVEYPLAQQKDAILVAVLAHHGGLFLDVDSLLCTAPEPLLRSLQAAEVSLYGHHLASVAARPGSALMERWLEILRDVLAVPRRDLVAAYEGRYFQLGNHSFELLREELVSGRRQPVIQKENRQRRLLKKVRRKLLMETRYRDRIQRLHRVRSGYLPELRQFRGRSMSPQQKYRAFWFDPEIPVGAALRDKPSIIALHHSWTPPWYVALDREQLGEDNSLLSRILRQMLGDTADAETAFANLTAGSRSAHSD